VEKVARPVITVDLPPAANPVLPIEAVVEPKKAEPAAPMPVVAPLIAEPVASIAAQPQVPPIVLAEPAMLQKAIELKPAAERTGDAPVILGPPPVVVDAPPVATAPAAPIPAAEPSSAEPSVLEAKETAKPVETQAAIHEAKEGAALVGSALEPIAPAPPMPVISSAAPLPTALESQKIVIDWGADLPAKPEAPKEPATPANEVEAQRLEPAVEEPKLAPIESPDIDDNEEKIHLRLAAILKHCPPEIIVGQLPHVDDSVRITLPFAPIDRQLVKGHVEVSALRFIVALPEVYHKYFVAKLGVKVPIPLEEVFQNLPSLKHELTPAPPTPPPVVLAPAPAAVAPVPEAAPAEKAEEQVDSPSKSPSAVAGTGEVKTEEPSPVETKGPAPTASTAPVQPPPLPTFAPAETPKAEMPPAPAAVEEVALAAAVEPEPVATPLNPILAAADLPERLTAEQAAQPPVPSATDIATEVTEPPPVEFTVPSLPVQPSAANAAPTGDEAPKLVLQPPVFRPHFISPPPIFGFASTPAAPDAEPPAKVEPPSVLTGLAESHVTEAVPTGESATQDRVAADLPATKEVAAEAATMEAVTDGHITPSAPVEPPPASTEAPSSAKTETPRATASESEPSAELIAFASEHGAPDIAHFSGEPVPFADLTESLAHETTYAPDLAEVVHVDIAGSEPVSPKVRATEITEGAASEVADSEKRAAVDEHRPVSIAEGLAVTAVAATMTEHVPLNFSEVVAPVEETRESESAAEQPETPTSVAPAVEEEIEEPVTAEQTPVANEAVVEQSVAAEEAAVELSAPASEVAPAGEQTIAEGAPDEVTPSPTPATPVPEQTNGLVPPPPPHPLFPLPKISPAPVHVEVLPPPSLPLRRFDQDAVQALFMTEETLDLPKISRLAAALPGVYACVIATRDQACTGGTLPEGFDLAALLGLAPRVGEAAGRMPIGQLKHFTLYGDAYSVSFFERNGLSLCAVHRPRSFVPGVREKLVALADELSR
jgi:hypothetical protein